MKNDTKFILTSFITWRIVLFLFLAIAILYIPLQETFLGGGIESYLKAPFFWSWANFDGEHYLSIAYQGYLPLTYFFFPAYPFLISLISSLVKNSFLTHAIVGFVVSNIIFLFGLAGFWKLMELDFSKTIRKNAILLLLLFPTSFYFGSVYTESLFFTTVVWSFYFARERKWIISGLLGAIATATRVVGLALVPALIVELIIQHKKKRKNLLAPFAGIATSLLGIGGYMLYLFNKTGDSLSFMKSVEIFGQQRSSTFVLLPQVFYRYFFKVLPNINYSYFPVVFSTYLEIATALLFLVLVVIAFKKLRLSYAIYFALGYLIPTLSGSFSSFHRYVLVLFPAFILVSKLLIKVRKKYLITILLFLVILLGIATSLFTRGFWIA